MTANYMYPPVVVNIDQPNPPCFFICQKVIISVLNTISALFVGFLALVCLFGIIFGSSKVVFIVLLPVYLLTFAHLCCGIYGAVQEDERVFLVSLVLSGLGTLLYIAGAFYYAVKSSENKRERWYSSSEDYYYSDSSSGLKIVCSVVINIAWTAFLAAFARNLRRWNRQKVNWRSGAQTGMMVMVGGGGGGGERC